MFCISFVVVTVRARLVDFDRHLEEAAADLGATGMETFRLVTLPLLGRRSSPRAARLRDLRRRLRHHVLQLRQRDHVPRLRLGPGARGGVPPQVNVIGSAIFLVAVGIMLVSVIVQTRRRKETAA